jgi:hypothetical protein
MSKDSYMLPIRESQPQNMDRKWIVLGGVSFLVLVAVIIGVSVHYSSNGDNSQGNQVGLVSEFEKEQINDRTTKFKPKWRSNNKRITYKEFLDGLKNGNQLLDDFISALKDGTTYDQYYFESIPVTSSTQDKDYEFVLVKSYGLDRPATPNIFQSHFTNQCLSVQFLSLGGDTTLISPCPPNGGSMQTYVHLAPFVKNGPVAKVKDALKKASGAMQDKLSQTSSKWWWSTAGGAVAWLHIRIDPRPKYYNYGPYKRS